MPSATPRELDWDQMLLIAGGHTAFQLLWAGVELALYDSLSSKPNQTLQELASEMGIEPQPARILLIGLTAIGVVKRDGEGRYTNAALTEARLVRNKPAYAAPILGWQAHIVYPGLQDFLPSLRLNRNVGLQRFEGNESTLYERLTHNPALEKIFQDAMAALSHQANSFLPKAMDFGKYKYVVDAGGGNGANAMAIASAYPKVRASVFDSPSVCSIAVENIKSCNMGERVTTWPGNFFSDPFPPEADCIVFCHILTIWSMAKNLALLRRAYDALPKGGAVVIFNMMGADDDSGPLSTALGSPYFLAIATGEGMLHPWKDYETALREAGFQQITRVEQGLPLDHGILIGVK